MPSPSSESIAEVQSSALDLSDAEIDLLLDFFQILDEWDREQQSPNQLNGGK
jgi:hypothetical protein